MNDSGTVYYLDHYGTEYEVSWIHSGPQLDTIDITTITRQPYVWGETYSSTGKTAEERGGYVDARRAFRRGVITTVRQLLKPTSAGYEIVSEGHTQEIGYFSPLRTQTSKFKHYLNHEYTDMDEVGTLDGPGFSDPDNLGLAVWADPSSPSANDLNWIDVWA
jgi:hypothetical protein